MAIILGLDTSTEACSAALSLDGQVTEKFEVCPRGHTKKILPMVQELLGQANLSVQDLDGIAVTRGPGSFTGVRLGICIAQGLAYGANKPVIPISTLEVVANQALTEHPNAQSAVVALDARMNEIYFAVYTRESDSLRLLSNEEVISPEALEPVHSTLFSQKVVGVGHGFEKFGESLINKIGLTFEAIDEAVLPRASSLVELALERYKKGDCLSPEQCQPIYLRNNVIQS